MAFFADMSDGKIKVISRRDRTIQEVTPEAYEAYLVDLDESILGITEETKCTRFVLRKVLTYKAQLKVKNAQVSMEDGVVKPQLSFMSEEVRLSLMDIENPDVPEDHKKYLLTYKRENDGGAGYNLMAILESAGVVNDLYAAKVKANEGNKLTDIDKKK